MEYRRIGPGGPRVSALGVGTLAFGAATGAEEAGAILDRAEEAGICFVDTADIYPGADRRGRTEEMVGEWLARVPGRRERMVVATKGHGDMRGPERPEEWWSAGLSARKLVAACEGSLRRLRTEWIDLYQFHRYEATCPWEELWAAAESLVASGKVRSFGSSNFAGWEIATAMAEARQCDFPGLISEQCPYNLGNRWVELEIAPAARQYGLGLLPYSPLWGGVLGGALERLGRAKEAGGPEGVKIRRPFPQRRLERHRGQVERWETWCREFGRPPGQVALAWLRDRPGVVAPIVGPRTLAQWEDALQSLDIHLSAEEVRSIEEIWPGPAAAMVDDYAMRGY